MRTKDVWRRRHRGFAVVIAAVATLAGCTAVTPEPSKTPVPTPTATAEAQPVLVPVVEDGAWLNDGYANGVESGPEVPGIFCGVSPDGKVLVTVRSKIVDQMGSVTRTESYLAGHDMTTGEELWATESADCDQTHGGDAFGKGTLPVRVDMATGAVDATYDAGWLTGDGEPATMLLTDVGGGVVTFETPLNAKQGDEVAAFDVDTGELLWTIRGTSDITECYLDDAEGAPATCLMGSAVELRDSHTGEVLPVDISDRNYLMMASDGFIAKVVDGSIGIYDFDGTLRQELDGTPQLFTPRAPANALYSAEQLIKANGTILWAVTADGDPIDTQRQADVEGVPTQVGATEISADGATALYLSELGFTNKTQWGAIVAHDGDVIETVERPATDDFFPKFDGGYFAFVYRADPLSEMTTQIYLPKD